MMNPTAESPDVLRVENLEVAYPRARGGGQVHAVRDVSFALRKHESLGLVGESGCGKSSIAGAVMGLNPVTAGHVHLEGDRQEGAGRTERLRRSRKIQIVFQDPLGALNPRMRVGQALEEVLLVHGIGESRSERIQKVAALLTRVGLPLSVMSRYPHEISGGQRQRVGIARAISVEPDVLIADEPVSALDVSVQVQILNLLKSLQKELGMAILFISHDLASVRYLCERVMVMYLGSIVEEGSADRLFQNPSHPYTHALLSAVPRLEDNDKNSRDSDFMLKGELPSQDEALRGCSFHPRCPLAAPECEVHVPAEVAVDDHQRSRCHFAERIAKNGLSGSRSA